MPPQHDPDVQRLRDATRRALLRTVAVAGLAATGLSAMAADARERSFIREGMAEGEVLLRIGKPDHVTLIRDVRGEPEEKTWSYFPASRDPQTITLITLRAGVVTVVERKIAR